MNLKNLVIFLGIILWPLNLYLANTPQNFITYLIPVLLLIVSYFLYKRESEYYTLPLLLIGLFEKKLVLFSIMFILGELLIRIDKKKIILLILSLLIFVFQFQAFRGQTVFFKDHEAQQVILRNTYLYPNVTTARIFQNKLRVYFNKINFNLFALVDTNNYFFGFHPGQIAVTNQNIFKYPFISLIFVLYGIYYISKNKERSFIFLCLISGLANLSILQNFDRNDFILWVPISLLFINGVNLMSVNNRKLWKIISFIFIVFSIPQFLRSYVEKIS